MNSGNSIILKKNQLKMSLNFLSQISWQVQYLHTLFSNLTGKLLKDSSEGDKVKIEINLDKSLKHYKLVFNSSNISENSLLQIESDLAILVTKKVVRRLNGIFEKIGRAHV